MKLVAGLGNPGAEYEWTRHNLGFEVLDGLAAKHRASWSGKPDAEIANWAGHAILVKPLTFMNLSGSAVQRWSHFYKIGFEDVLVVVDDVNLEAGRLRLRRGGGPGGHNGLKSDHRGARDGRFPATADRGRRGGSAGNLSSHVLGRFSAEEEAVVEEAIQKAVEAIEVFVAVGIVAAMDRYNRKDDKKTEDN